jgi:xanthine dehydrogenase accessory factor
MSRAHRVLATGEPQRVEVSLLEEDGFEDSPSICGGVLDVFVERLGDEIGGIDRARFFTALADADESGRALAVVTVTDVERERGAPGGAVRATLGRKTLVDDRGAQLFPLGIAVLDEHAVDVSAHALDSVRPSELEVMVVVEGSGPAVPVRLFAEPITAAPELVIVGAGHVGTGLARMAAHAGFVVTVLDDRPTFANPARLPEAHHILTGDPRDTLASMAPRRGRHMVLVTRGHRLDADCLRIALDMDLAYLGMIGSRRRVRRIKEWLREQGAAEDRIAALHAPIGLDIGAETPAEIAVAILAEIVQHRRRRAGAF